MAASGARTSTNWWNGSAGTAWSNAAGSTAVFGAGGTAGTVTLGTGITAGGLTFNPVSAGSYTIAGGGNTLTLNNGATITTNANATISANLAAGGAANGTLNFGGTGTLTLIGTTTMTIQSQIFINTGAVVIDTGGSVTDNNLFQDIGNKSNASLTVQGLGQYTTNSALNIGDNASGSDSLTISGSAHVTVTDGSYNLGVDFDGGAGTLNLSGGTLTTLRIAQRSGASVVNFNGGVVQGINTSGTNFLGGIGTANVLQNGAIIDPQTYNITISQALLHAASLGTSLDGGLTKLSSGTLTLSGSNTYTGPTTINQGTLTLANSAALLLSTLNTSGAGTLSFGALTAATIGGLSGSGALALTNTASSNNGVALTVGGNNLNTAFSGNLSGGTLTKTGTGLLTLSGSDTYTGGTTVSAGLLSFATTAAVPPGGAISIASGGYAGIAADLNSSGFLAKVSAASTGVIGIDGGTTTTGLNLTGFAEALRVGSATSGTLSGTFTPQNTTYHVGGGGGTLTVISNLADAGGPTALEMNTSGGLPGGIVVLAGSNTFSGGTQINVGELSVSADAYLGNNSSGITFNGGTLQVTGTNYNSTARSITLARAAAVSTSTPRRTRSPSVSSLAAPAG